MGEMWLQEAKLIKELRWFYEARWLEELGLLKGTHARDFIVRFSHFFGIIQ